MAKVYVFILVISMLFGCQQLTNNPSEKPVIEEKPTISAGEQAAYNSAMKGGIIECNKYVSQYPGGELKTQVVARYFELLKEGTTDDCLDFIKILPNSSYIPEVKNLYAEKKEQEDFEIINTQKPKDDLEYLTAVADLCKKFIEEFPASMHKTAVMDKYFEFVKFGPSSIAIDFLKQFPKDKRADETKKLIKDKFEAEIYEKLTKHEISIEMCSYYLKEYPQGKYRKEIADELFKFAQGASLDACKEFIKLLPNDSRIDEVKRLEIELERRQTLVVFDKFMQSKTLKWELVLNGDEYTIKKGVYQILEPIIVSKNAKLIIEPGTVFNFGNNTGIICFGVMICEGLPDDRISFSALKDNAWNNIVFVGSKASESSIKYTNISGGKGLSTKDSKVAKFLSLENEYFIGGSILCLSEASPTFESCEISNNKIVEKTTVLGGGLCVWGKSSPIFLKCKIMTNNATWGGGVYIYEESNPTFTECMIYENKSATFGAGVCISGGNPKFDNCEISKNTSISTKEMIGGGGIYCSETKAEFSKCIIKENKASSGAGVFLAKGASPIFTETIINQNNATVRGAGVLCTNSNVPLFEKCEITKNVSGAKEFGGGIDCVDKFSNPQAKEDKGNIVKDNLPRDFYFE